MEMSKDFKEFFELLNRNNVRYVVVGGYAYSIHAEPRYTKDLDIFFDRKEENAVNLQNAINNFGFESLNLEVQDFTKPGRVIQIGYPPFRIDLLNQIEGVTFEEVWPNKIKARYDSEPFYVIGKKELIKNKKAVGRDQDLVDVKRLEK